MRSAIPVRERPARSALTVAVNCVNRTGKHAASVTAYSVLPACPSIQCSTPKLHQQTTGKFGNEKELRIRRMVEISRAENESPFCRAQILILIFSLKDWFIISSKLNGSPDLWVATI